MENECCALCLESIESSETTMLDCNHRFHTFCLNELQTESVDLRCPVCRKTFDRTMNVNLWQDRLHWKLFVYGSEIFFAWVSEFDTLHGMLNYVVFDSNHSKLIFQTHAWNIDLVPITDIWASTKTLAEFIAAWVEREYPIFQKQQLFPIIYSMIIKDKTAVCFDISQLHNDFLIIQNGNTLYFATPQQPLFEFVVKKIDRAVAIRTRRCWRLCREQERTKILFQNEKNLIKWIIKWFRSSLAPHVLFNIKNMVLHSIQHLDFDDYVVDSVKPQSKKPQPIISCLGFEFYVQDIDDWTWVYDNDLSF